MNTEITLKGIPLTRSGYSKRGFTSAAIILAASHNSSNKTISVKYMGCRIGYISHIHYDNLPDGRVGLRGDISFPLSNLIAHREILNNKDVYPVCIIETASAASEARLSEVILFTEEEREFDEQEPLNLSELRELVNSVAKPKPTNAFIPFSEDTKFTPVLEMRFIGKALETRLSLNNKTLGHVHSCRAHIGKPETNSEDVFHLQELHVQFHKYISKELLSKTSFVQD
ncbi:hypothetical protein J9R26_000632 [Salmonella enterica]|nr:hypothetical protein [Salmonella enterica]EHI6359493.1 hypothetical protein [Salmonella enterica]EHI9810686.1 hypothetical protein [Salmonella enterica]